MAKHKPGSPSDNYTLYAKYGSTLIKAQPTVEAHAALEIVVREVQSAFRSLLLSVKGSVEPPSWVTNRHFLDIATKESLRYDAQVQTNPPEADVLLAAVHRYWLDRYVEGVSFELWCRVYDTIRLGSKGAKDKEADKKATEICAKFLGLMA